MSDKKPYHNMVGVRIVAFIRKHPNKSAREISQALSISEARTFRTLSCLHKYQIIYRGVMSYGYVYYMTTTQFERFQDSLLGNIGRS